MNEINKLYPSLYERRVIANYSYFIILNILLHSNERDVCIFLYKDSIDNIVASMIDTLSAVANKQYKGLSPCSVHRINDPTK